MGFDKTVSLQDQKYSFCEGIQINFNISAKIYSSLPLELHIINLNSIKDTFKIDSAKTKLFLLEYNINSCLSQVF